MTACSSRASDGERRIWRPLEACLEALVVGAIEAMAAGIQEQKVG